MRTESRELLAVGIFGNKSRVGDRIEMLLRRGRTFSPRASAGGVVASAPRWIAFAQEQQPRPSFEVASVKPGDPDSRQVSLRMQPGGRFTAANASLQMLIRFAYNVRDHQISGGPNWLDSAKFNVEAKAGAATSIPQMVLMLQSLLAERFRVAVHRETREEQVYELTLDRGGSRLKEATSASVSRQGFQEGKGQLIGTACPMPELVKVIAQSLGRSVIDKTGLHGKYDFTLRWTPDPDLPAGPEELDAAAPPDPSDPSIFTALQEDLGLRLQSARGPVEILVIDHAEKPDAN